MNSDITTDIMGKLGDSSVDFFSLAGILADPLTRKILAKLNSNGSPISIDAVPVDKLDADRPSIINRLITLDKVGFVNSVKVPSTKGFCKKYIINDKGTMIVNLLMSSESMLFKS